MSIIREILSPIREVFSEVIATVGLLGLFVKYAISGLFGFVTQLVLIPLQFVISPDKQLFIQDKQRKLYLQYTLVKRKLTWFLKFHPQRVLFRFSFMVWLIALVVLAADGFYEGVITGIQPGVKKNVSQEIIVRTPRGQTTIITPVAKKGDTDDESLNGLPVARSAQRAVLGAQTIPGSLYSYTSSPTTVAKTSVTSGQVAGVINPVSGVTIQPTSSQTSPNTPVPTINPTPSPTPIISQPSQAVPTITNTPTPTRDPGILARGVPNGYSAYLASDDVIGRKTDVTAVGQRGVKAVRIYKGGLLLAEVTVNFDNNPDFSGFYGDADPTSRKSYISVPSGLSSGGQHILYIPKLTKDNKVTICPQAYSYSDVHAFCPGRINGRDGYVDGDLAISNIGNYWRISGVTGTGGSSTFVNDVTDVMTRQKVSTLSSHSISFVLSSSETFSANEWVTFDFHEDSGGFVIAGSSITTSDVSFSDGTLRTIRAIQSSGSESCTGYNGTNDMVVVYNDAAGTVKFRACGSYTISATGASVTAHIGTAAGGTNRVTNPATAGSYEVGVPNDFGDADFAFDVPIMDDDQVSIYASVDTFITFDIDVSNGHGDSNTPYAISLQELTYSTYNDESTSGVSEIYLDLDTNAANGVTVEVRNTNGSNGLSSSSTSDSIPSIDGALSSGTNDGNYGLAAVVLNGLTLHSNFSKAAGNVGNVDTTYKTVFTLGGPVAGGSGQVNVRAISGVLSAAADDYTDTLTFRATAVF